MALLVAMHLVWFYWRGAAALVFACWRDTATIEQLIVNCLGRRVNLDQRAAVCDDYDFQARILIKIYLGLNDLANRNTNIIRLTLFWQIQIQMYLDIFCLDKYK